MKWFKKRDDEEDSGNEVRCEHVTLVPTWDDAADIGQMERVSLYRCEACGETFTLEETERLRETEAARLRRLMAS